MLSAAKQAIRIKLATTVVHFLPDLDLGLDLDFENVYMACPSGSFWGCLLLFLFRYIKKKLFSLFVFFFFFFFSLFVVLIDKTNGCTDSWNRNTHHDYVTAQLKDRSYIKCCSMLRLLFLFYQETWLNSCLSMKSVSKLQASDIDECEIYI